jgi:glycosyltransferase involved in cell wall biosynthesis
MVGNYSWAPTHDAAQRLLGRIWPIVVERNSTARLRLVGAGLDSQLEELARGVSNVDPIGPVSSVLPFLQDADVFAFPVRMGTGRKIKLAEALSAGCAIVTTSVGLAGFPPSARDAVVVTDTDQDTAEAIHSLLVDGRMRDRISEQALRFVRTLTRWDEAAEMLLEGWRQIENGHR